ncbi:MAG: aminopeptidase P family protein [Caldilineaceae bacterium]|nr:aminopeptidase P family protein [Caldilineaceae bacterium]
MKSDLNQLMNERNLDGFLVLGNSSGNQVLNYLTGGAHLEQAVVFQKRGGPVTLIHGGMERDNALRTGLALVERDKVYNPYTFLHKHAGDELAATADYLAQVMADHDLQGRIGVYGTQDAGAAYALLTALQATLSAQGDKSEIVGEYGGETIFMAARATKDDAEIAEMHAAGRLTSLVVGETWDFLQGHAVEGETLVTASGEALTIGDVKRFIRERISFYGMTEDHEAIFSLGRDAGVPHNSGNPADALRLGQSIIFDIYPRLASGYYHDMTRTWSLGYASPQVQQAWDECKEIFDRVMAAANLGVPCRELQLMTCAYFEEKGHPVSCVTPGLHDGYVHSLGHGVGLDVHEQPRLSHAQGNKTLLSPGHVVSIEPGLYYPDRGFGVRIEDTIAFTEAGERINLTDFRYDLVIPLS